MPEELQRTLSFPVLLVIIVNSIIGTGVFFLPAVGASKAGPASIISWIILAIVSIYLSMIFAELTSMFPKAGGVYEYCKQAYGRFPSFLIGWMTILGGNFTISMLIVGAIQYLIPGSGLISIIGFSIPASYAKLLIAVFFILFFNYIAFKGIQTSAAMIMVFGFLTLGTLLSIIFPGVMNFDISQFSMSSEGVVNFLPFGIMSIFVAIFFISETFFGFEAATFLAGETKDGERVVPKAIIIATAIIAFIALLFVIVAFGNVPWDLFGMSASPLTYLGTHFYGTAGESAFMFLVFFSIIGSVAGWIVSAPRLLLAMAEDKLLLGHFKEVHPKNKTPHKAILFQTIFTLVMVFIAYESYEYLLSLVVPLDLIMYSFVVASILILRKKLPHHKRYFKVPFAKVGVVFTILFLAFLTYAWIAFSENAWEVFRFGLSLIFLGIPVYFLIEVYYDPKAIVKVNDSFAYLALLTERISLPKHVMKQIFLLLGDLRGKTVLEYGCNVGTLTVSLAEKVGPYGKVYATDISVKHLQITEKRVKKTRYITSDSGKVETVLDENQMLRIHPSIPYADVVISVGMLGYVQDLKKILADISDILPEGGEICFVEFGEYFGVIPNVEWLSSNQEIERIFRESGFSVRVVREKGVFWNYIYVSGIKSKEDIPFI